MNILYYYPNYQTNMFQWQKHHIIDELSDYGIEFHILSPLDYSNKESANNAILERIRSKNYQVFMTSYHEDYLYIDTLLKIRNSGVKTLLFCPDNLVVPYNHRKIAKHFDLVWLTSFETKYLFDKWGANSIFLPYAANPKFLKYYKHDEDILRVGFIGTPHGSRIVTINELLDGGIPVTVHSKSDATNNSGLKSSFGSYVKVLYNNMRYPIGRRLAVGAIKDKMQSNSIHDNELYELKEPVQLSELSNYNSAYALTLSFTNANSTGTLKHPVKIVNLRNFELPMCGAVQFCEYSDEMASYFEDGKEIVMYRSIEEMREKAKYYLESRNSGIRDSIRINARIRAENEHTWFKRFSVVFSKLNIDF